MKNKEKINTNESAGSEGMTRRKFLELGLAAGGLAMAAPVMSMIDDEAKQGMAEIEARRLENLRKLIEEEGMRPGEGSSGSRPQPSAAETKPIERKRPENMTPELAACEDFVDGYFEIANSKEYPSEVFSDIYFMSVAAAESRGQKNARSRAGAVGWMQIMPSAVKEADDYLATMKKKGHLKNGGPGKLDDKKIDAIIEASAVNADYNRAIGKLYFMTMWDERFGRYNVGRGFDPKRFKNEGEKASAIAARQDDLAACYNMGPSKFRRKKMNREFFGMKMTYPDETVAYIRRIRNNMADFGTVFAEIGRRGWAKDNYLAFSVVNADDIARPGAERDFVRQELFQAVAPLIGPDGKANQSKLRDTIDKKTVQLEAFLADQRRKEKEAANSKNKGKQMVAKK
jgi:hypothetical protein